MNDVPVPSITDDSLETIDDDAISETSQNKNIDPKHIDEKDDPITPNKNSNASDIYSSFEDDPPLLIVDCYFDLFPLFHLFLLNQTPSSLEDVD